MNTPGRKIVKDPCGCFLAVNGIYKCNLCRGKEVDMIRALLTIGEEIEAKLKIGAIADQYKLQLWKEKINKAVNQ